MSLQDVERRVSELEDEYKKLEEKYVELKSDIARYEAMSSGARWVFAILASIVAFVASVKALLGKFIAF